MHVCIISFVEKRPSKLLMENQTSLLGNTDKPADFCKKPVG